MTDRAIIGLGEHALPTLSYSYDALEPFIDARTMELHHSKHHQAYVNGLNAAEKGLADARSSGDYSKIAALERAIAFHGAGHANHTVFWANMGPAALVKKTPGGALREHLDRDFGGLDAFKAQFNAAAAAVEGNGWGMLVYQAAQDRLYTLGVMNHQNLLLPGSVPLLVLDVWEHAYYLNYQNRRPDYIAGWWNVVDWADVERRYIAARKV